MLRRALPKKTAKEIQDVVNNIKNKPLLRHINRRRSIAISCVCLVIVLILYQFDYFSKHDKVHTSSHSSIGSFMNPYASSRPNNQQLQRSDTMHANQMIAPKSQISPEIFDKLQMRKTPISKLHSPVWPLAEIGPLLMPYTKQSWTEQCESSTFMPYNFYNYMIKPDEIEYIFPSNDKDLYNLINSDDFTFHWDVSFLGDDFWEFVGQLATDSESASVDVATLKEIFQSQRSLLGLNQASLNRLFDWNGLTADLSLYMRQAHSVGDDDLAYWLVTDTCIEHKSCDVYPIHRVLHRSKQISCKDILTTLLPPIFDCVSQHGRKCKNVIDSGYYRIIMKTTYPPTGEQVVIKMMKPKSIKKERDLIRHIREAILLGHLYDLEEQYLMEYDDDEVHSSNDEDEDKTRRIFTQSLNGGKFTKKRAFNYVEEYGHCVTPLWISVSPLYKMPLDKWIASGMALKSTLQKLIFMVLQIAYSVELIHNIPGGPFHHTDIQPRQFLLDENDNVYINDFNRGKFQPYYFGDEFDASIDGDAGDGHSASGDSSNIQKCWYCGHRSRGHWRAPEEPRRYPLNEKLDIFSMGLTIWALFSSDIPFKSAKFEDLTFLYWELRRTPPMPANMPPAIKDVVRACLSWNPRQRPSATQVVQSLEEIYYSSLEWVTEGMQKKISKDLLSDDFWSETNDPPPQPRDKQNKQ